MPPGTVYMVPFQEPEGIGIYPWIYIKGETGFFGDDWYCTPTDNWNWGDYDEVSGGSEAFDEARHRDIPMDYESEERHDDDRKWIRKIAVLSDADVTALCRALTGS